MIIMEDKKMDNNFVETHIKDFLLGGKAEFTIKNMNSGKFHKYKVSVGKTKDIWFVRILDGNKITYAGYLKYDLGGELVYAQGSKGMFAANDEVIVGLLWVFRHSEKMNPAIKIIHHGKCARCGKKLSDEESIGIGFGPHCWELVKAMRIKSEVA